MTAYTAGSYTAEIPISYPLAGAQQIRGKYTFATGVAFTSGDTLKIFKVPKGAVILPELCYVQTKTDLDSDNNFTLKMEVSDGTTTKVIFAAAALQSATTVRPLVTDVAATGFKTGNSDFYIILTATAGELNTAALLYYGVGWTMDSFASDSTS